MITGPGANYGPVGGGLSPLGGLGLPPGVAPIGLIGGYGSSPYASNVRPF
jgi:hypothetical protein